MPLSYVEPSICTVSIWNGSVRCGYCAGSANRSDLESDITGANVFVDTIPPTIALIGDADYTVLVNTNFNDPNATASDGSPGYSASDYSRSETGILNTSMINSTVNYTYTAYDDAAGNPGASINRTVTVIDYNLFTLQA